MVLVDTSVWIDFFRGKSSKEKDKLKTLIHQEKEVALCGIILQEILQGIPSDLEYHQIKQMLLEFPYLTLEEPLLFEKAAQIYRKCSKQGYTIRKPIDCLIAAIAIEYQVSLLHKDKDFVFIAKHHALNLLE